MKINTSELTGAALDWAVAKALGLHLVRKHSHFRKIATHWGEAKLAEYFAKSKDEWMHLDTVGNMVPFPQYSASWAHSGPIIDRMATEGLLLQSRPETGSFAASIDSPNRFWYGTSYLQAAMRCYVASKLGTVVDVPDDLVIS
jgi:hypothetical protein